MAEPAPPRALLLHGLGSDPETMWRIRGWLEDVGWSVTVPALLGHAAMGPAPRYALADYAAALPIGPWDLVVGHSLGAAVTVTAAAAQPGWATRVVLLDPVIVIDDSEREEIREDQRLGLETTLDQLRASVPDWDERDLAAKFQAVQDTTPEAAVRSFDDQPVWDLRGSLNGLTVPVLVIAGDPTVYTMFSTDTEREVTRSGSMGGGRIEVVRIAGAAHSPHRERPEATRDALLGWLART